MTKKILVLLVVLGVCALTMSSVSAIFGFGEDSVEVIDVQLYEDYRVDSATSSAISDKEFDAETYGNSGSIDEMLGMNDLSENDNFDIPLGILINLKAKDTVKDVTATKIQNVEITYNDGSVQKVGNFTFDEGNTYNEYVKDENYSLPCTFVFNQTLWNGTTHFSEFCQNAHIKGDMVVDTSSESDKVIGHLDNDVTSMIQ